MRLTSPYRSSPVFLTLFVIQEALYRLFRTPLDSLPTDIVPTTSTIYHHLVRKIGAVRRLEGWIALQTGAINALTSVLVVSLAAVTVEAIGWFDTPERTAISWSAAVLAGLLAAWFLLPPIARILRLLPSQSDDTIAHRVGRGIPDIGDRLINTLQLYRASLAGASGLGFSPELVDASIVVEGEPLRAYDYTVIVERDQRKRALLFFLIASMLTGVLFIGFPGTFRSAFTRLTDHTTHYVVPAPFHLEIAPGNRKVVVGDSAAIVVRAVGVPPQRIRLRTESAEGGVEETELKIGRDGLYRHTLALLRFTTSYRAICGPVKTAEHVLTVVEPPEVRSLRVAVVQPSYARRSSDILPENTGDVSGLRGSGVSVRIESNVALSKGTIVQLLARPVRLASVSNSPVATLYDTLRIPMKVDGTKASGTFRLSRQGEYYIDLVSTDGVRSVTPAHYTMSVSTDGHPSIALVEPSKDSTTVDRTMILPTEVRIADDYGFSWLRLHYRLVASRYEAPWKEFRSIPIRIPSGGSPLEVPYIWDMTRMRIVPEDELEFYFEVADNDIVDGPKRSRTDTVKIRFPSLDEILQEAEHSGQQANQALEQVMQQAQSARQEMEELNRELMRQLAQNRDGEAGWQEKKKLQDLMRKHEQMQKQLEEIAETLRQNAERLREAQAISPETMQKYQELQKLFENTRDQKLLEEMRQLQQQMDQMTPEQMAEAMKNYRFNEEEFRQSIERTMNILKRMQIEQKVDEMIRRAQELEQKQGELNDQAARTPRDDQAMRNALAERQKALARQAEKIREEARKLTDRMGEFPDDMPTDQMRQAQQEFEQDDPSGQMEQAGRQMEQGEMDQAQQRGKRARESTEAFRRKMEDARKQMQANSQRQVTNKMKKAMQDLLELSRQEESLRRKTEGAQPNSSAFRDLARTQEQIREQMESLTEQLMRLGQKTFAITPEMGRELGEALGQMEQATRQLEGRDGQGATRSEGNAMGAMNRAAQQMGEMIAQMEKGQGMGMGMGMGASQRLQQMAAQQQMINEAMAQMMGQGGKGAQGRDGKGENGEGENGQGEGGSEGDPNDPRLRRLKQQQQQVKKSLEELQQETRQGGGTRKNMVGDLDRAAREIEEVLRDMASGQISPETRQRQERILSRLLDAVRSQRERDFERERESRGGVDVVRSSPPELALPNRDMERLRRDLLRAREQGYSKDYEALIRQYLQGVGGR